MHNSKIDGDIMRFKIFILTAMCFVSLHAQNKMFDMEDVIMHSYTTLAPEKLLQLQWIPGDKYISYLQSTDPSVLVKENVETGKKENIFSLEQINRSMSTIDLSGFPRFPAVSWIDNHTISFWQDESYVYYDFTNQKPTIVNKINADGANKTIAPNGKFVAFTYQNNLYYSTAPENVIQITKDTNPDIVNGQAVHRNEFGIETGIFWSPQGNYIAFYRMDQTMVTDYPLVNIDTRPATLHNIKYPMTGQTSHEVTIGIYNLKTGNTIWLKTGEPKDKYLTAVTWGPEEKFMYVGILNRDQNHLQLVKYDSQTGNAVDTLFEEKSDKYVEPLNPLFFVKGHNDEFLWFSQRDGFNHFYLYNTNGKLIKQVTKGDWVITSGYDTFKEADELIFDEAVKLKE